MTSLTKRVLTTVIAVPAVFSLIFFLPHVHFLAFTLLATAAAFLGTRELKNLYRKATGVAVGIPATVIALFPVAQWVEQAYLPTFPLVDLLVVLTALIAFTKELHDGIQDDFSHTMTRVGGDGLLIIYPGLLLTFIIRVTMFSQPSLSLIFFFLLVFGNDVFAFIFGMLFGKNNRGIVKVSPNKSLAGFIGGGAVAVVLAILYNRFVFDAACSLATWQAIVLGLAMSFAANVGDLIESAFKRSAKVKDSGTLVPGRGGILDSLDSLLACAPVFWVLLDSFLP